LNIPLPLLSFSVVVDSLVVKADPRFAIIDLG